MALGAAILGTAARIFDLRSLHRRRSSWFALERKFLDWSTSRYV